MNSVLSQNIGIKHWIEYNRLLSKITQMLMGMEMYSFVTNCHKLGGLKQQKFIFLQIRRPEIKGSERAHSLCRFRENLFLASSSFWSMSAILSLWLLQSSLCFHLHIFFAVHLISLGLSLARNLWWHLNSNLINQKYLLISRF